MRSSLFQICHNSRLGLSILKTPVCKSRRHALGKFSPRALCHIVALIALLLFSAWGTEKAAIAQCPPAWVPGIGNPGTTAQVNALDILPNGDVIVGSYGSFPISGGTTSFIARYNFASSTWSRLGSSADAPSLAVFALSVLPSGDVVVGGQFPPCIKKCELSAGGRWTYGGAEMNNYVWALASLPSGDTVAGGSFTGSGGLLLNRIGRLTFGGWKEFQPGSPSSNGTNGQVNTLVVLPDGDVIAGGSFSTAGGASGFNNIARFDPATGFATSLGLGTNGTVNAVALLQDGTLLVGGSFTSAGGVTGRNNIARVNVNTGVWSSAGSGTNGPVNCLAVLLNGNVIVGGSFTSAGGVAGRNNIARYSPIANSWTAMGTGVNNTVRALKVLPAGDVVVGGDFTIAGGQTANRLARYYFGGNAPSITAQPLSLAVSPTATAIFSITADAGAGGTGGIPSYQWRKNGVAINTTTNPSAATETLIITNVQSADLGSYSCLVTNSCGNVVSNAATLSLLTDICPADFNDDGVVDLFDYLDFVQAFSIGC